VDLPAALLTFVECSGISLAELLVGVLPDSRFQAVDVHPENVTKHSLDNPLLSFSTEMRSKKTVPDPEGV
jgi:hypothetical protein